MDDKVTVLARIKRVKQAITDMESVIHNSEPEEFLALVPLMDACIEKMKSCLEAEFEMTARQVYELELSRDRLAAAQFRFRFLSAHTRDP